MNGNPAILPRMIKTKAVIINETKSTADLASIQESVTACEELASLIKSARFAINDDGHLVIQFTQNPEASGLTSDSMPEYAGRAADAEADATASYDKLANTDLFLNTDGHLIAEYPSD